jgi:hypothetical protein
MGSLAGKGQKFTLATVDLSSNISSVSLSESIDLADTTNLGDDDKTSIVTLKSGSVSFEGHFDAGTGAVDDTVGSNLGTAQDWEYFPGGDVASEVKYSGSLYISSYEVSGSVDGIVEFSAEGTVDGAVTRAVIAP